MEGVVGMLRYRMARTALVSGAAQLGCKVPSRGLATPSFEKPLEGFRALGKMKAERWRERLVTLFGDISMLGGTAMLAVKCYYVATEEERDE